jgi:outer membrane protein assembly factor BamB
MRGSVIYVGSLDNSDLVALNVDTGTTEWRKELAGATAAGVTVDGDTIIVASFDRALHSLDAAAGGTERWRFEGDGWFVGTPLVTKDAIYAATMRGTVYAVDKSGKQIWSRAHPDREFRSSPILAGDTLVIAARDGTILGLNVADGAEKWSTEPQGAIDADGLLLESSLFYITTSRALLRVDPADGAIRSFNTQPPDGSK